MKCAYRPCPSERSPGHPHCAEHGARLPQALHHQLGRLEVERGRDPEAPNVVRSLALARAGAILADLHGHEHWTRFYSALVWALEQLPAGEQAAE